MTRYLDDTNRQDGDKEGVSAFFQGCQEIAASSVTSAKNYFTKVPVDDCGEAGKVPNYKKFVVRRVLDFTTAASLAGMIYVGSSLDNKTNPECSSNDQPVPTLSAG
ncbi:MAG TPA: hypothetical protein PK513_06420 [Alphaproteobacteria bacterium]|nr:hypothetical protein [Alphaproteobacteria bacterium]USO04706.1 MAG: hypothetical protein H6859_05925 [Rhodospirillales bacterium]HOO82117.1 hypothetical protein [Alphaproteobacteria bacterium]